MTLFEILKNEIGLPVEYGTQRKTTAPPYLAIRGDGQERFMADDTIYWKKNAFLIEYYFKEKSAETEELIESVLLANGYIYEKSEDLTIDDEGIYMIYYYV